MIRIVFETDDSTKPHMNLQPWLWVIESMESFLFFDRLWAILLQSSPWKRHSAIQGNYHVWKRTETIPRSSPWSRPVWITMQRWSQWYRRILRNKEEVDGFHRILLELRNNRWLFWFRQPRRAKENHRSSTDYGEVGREVTKYPRVRRCLPVVEVLEIPIWRRTHDTDIMHAKAHGHDRRFGQISQHCPQGWTLQNDIQSRFWTEQGTAEWSEY